MEFLRFSATYLQCTTRYEELQSESDCATSKILIAELWLRPSTKIHAQYGFICDHLCKNYHVSLYQKEVKSKMLIQFWWHSFQVHFWPDWLHILEASPKVLVRDQWMISHLLTVLYLASVTDSGIGQWFNDILNQLIIYSFSGHNVWKWILWVSVIEPGYN